MIGYTAPRYLVMGGTTSLYSAAQTQDSLALGITKSRFLKEQYGFGISSSVVIVNNTDMVLHLGGKGHFSGRFQYDPPTVIEAKRTGVFLHCHRDSALAGSVGVVEYSIGAGAASMMFYVGWSTPYSGHNRIGIQFGTNKPADMTNMISICEKSDGEYKANKQNPNTSQKFEANAYIYENKASVIIVVTIKQLVNCGV